LGKVAADMKLLLGAHSVDIHKHQDTCQQMLNTKLILPIHSEHRCCIP